MLTCPSPAMTTRPRCRSDRMVVARIGSGSRVRAVIGVHQTAEVDVRVALRRREARVAEELLDGPEIGPRAEQMRGEGVAERVRRGFGGRAARQHVTVHEAPDAPCREPSAPGVAERSEEHTSELQSQSNLVCRLLLEKKKIR